MIRPFAYGVFDDLRSRDIRFLREAASFGPLAVLLLPDEAVARIEGDPPRFSLAERRYFLEALRWVAAVVQAGADADPDKPDPDLVATATAAAAATPAAPTAQAASATPAVPGRRENSAGTSDGAAAASRALHGAVAEDRSPRPLWVARSNFGPFSERTNAAKSAHGERYGICLRAIGEGELSGFPYEPPAAGLAPAPGAKRVVVTGCYDWVHTGHIRFFEEASGLGELNVVIGSDANLRLLKGEGHPLQGAGERRFVVGSMRRVARCLVSSGYGWMDAEPEIRLLRAERFVVNTDGDKPEKRDYCRRNGLEYIVLERRPKEGLPRRSSTDLRGF
jgi:cytidyltransferase-like protein